MESGAIEVKRRKIVLKKSSHTDTEDTCQSPTSTTTDTVSTAEATATDALLLEKLMRERLLKSKSSLSVENDRVSSSHVSSSNEKDFGSLEDAKNGASCANVDKKSGHDVVKQSEKTGNFCVFLFLRVELRQRLASTFLQNNSIAAFFC